MPIARGQRDRQNGAEREHKQQHKPGRGLKALCQTAMEQKRVEAADDAFFAWANQQDANKGASARTNAKIFGYQFVKQVLEIVLRTPRNATTDIPYSPKVLRYLMQQRCVSAGMVDGGLFASLRLRGDWVCRASHD